MHEHCDGSSRNTFKKQREKKQQFDFPNFAMCISKSALPPFHTNELSPAVIPTAPAEMLYAESNSESRRY